MTTRVVAPRRCAARTAVVLALTAVVAAACAQPGQLGHSQSPQAPAPAAAPPPAAPPAPQAGPQLLGGGRIDSRITIRTQGAADYSVRTEVLAAGQSTEWQRNPGTEVTSVQRGEVVLQRAPDGTCSETPYSSGEAFVIQDAVPYRLRNDGGEPVELLVTRLLAPEFPEPEPIRPPC